MVERDIYEVANQLGGYIDEATPAPLATFLRRESREAAKLAARIAELEAENERLAGVLEAVREALGYAYDNGQSATTLLPVINDLDTALSGSKPSLASTGAVKALTETDFTLVLRDDAVSLWCSSAEDAKRVYSVLEALSALEPAAPEGQQPVAWRYRFVTSIYGDLSDWFIADDLSSIPPRDDQTIQPLFTRPSEQAVTEDMVETEMVRMTVSETIRAMGGNPDEQIIGELTVFDAVAVKVRSALKASMESSHD